MWLADKQTARTLCPGIQILEIRVFCKDLNTKWNSPLKPAFAAFAIVLMTSTTAHARVYGVSGDFDLTPQRDYIQANSIVCNDEVVLFNLYDIAAKNYPTSEKRVDAMNALMDQSVARGLCKFVPPSSVWVIGIKTAKISGDYRKESLYGLAKIRIGTHFGYTFPNYVGQTGAMIIQAGRSDNEKNGRAIYQ